MGSAFGGLLAGLPGSGHPRSLSASVGISLVYQGFADGLTYVLPYLEEQLAASGAVATAALPAAPWPALRAGAGLPDADLVLTGCSPARARRLPVAASVVLPFRVNLTMPVAGDVLGARATITRDERRKFAKLRRRYGCARRDASGFRRLRWRSAHLQPALYAEARDEPEG